MRDIEITGQAIKGAKYNWRNFAPVKISWQQMARHQDEPAPYIYKEDVRVVWGGVTVLQGSIRKCSLEQAGNAWRWSIEACDLLQPLEGALCFGSSGQLSGGLGANISGGGGNVDIPRQIQIAGTIQRLLEDARACGLLPADVGIDVAVSAGAWMWDTAMGCDMYAGILRKLLGGRPGMVCWIDYSGQAPVIRVADGDALPVVTLDRVRDRLSSINLTPRPDLVPPAVGVVLTAGRQACRTQAWPRGANLHQEGCVTVQVALPSGGTSSEDDPPASSEDPVWDFTKPIVEVRGSKLPTGTGAAAKQWWSSKVSQLASLPGLQFGTLKKSIMTGVEGTDMSNYSTADSAQAYEHVSGQLSEACKTLKWCYVELKQYVYTDTRPPKGCEMLVPHTKQVGGKTRWYNWLRWQGRTINKQRMRYRANKSGDTGGDDGSDPPSSGGGTPPPTITEWPDYTPILRDYYNITRTTPWEGNINSLRAISPATLVGCRLTITDARKDYQDMATAVQGVSVDLAAESTSINTGVPAHLSLQDLVDRVQQLAAGQDALDQDQDKEGPVTTIQYDPESYKSPDAPTLGPAGEIVWTAAPEATPGYGFETRLDWDDEGKTVTGCRIRPGKILLNGRYIATAPETSGDWYQSSMTTGEIWLDVKFNSKGKLTGCAVMYEQGPINPIRLQFNEPEGETFSYSFHIATISGKEVIQYALGMIQIPVHGGTFYPYGPA